MISSHRRDPSGTLALSEYRVMFLQSDDWDRRRDHGALSAYAEDMCCYCYRPVAPGTPRLRLTRDDGGEWFVVVPPGRAELPDEKTFGHFSLPIGPDCLKRHPEFLAGLVGSPSMMHRC